MKPIHASRTMWTAVVTAGAGHLGARLGLTAEEIAWLASLGCAIIASLRWQDSRRKSA